MIPIRDENPSKTFPIVNILFMLTNLAVFIHQNFFFPGGPRPLFIRLGVVPYEFTHFVDIHPTDLVPVPLTLFTAMFMHGGFIHLAGNMLFLWIYGDNVEDRLGHMRYLFFYFLCGITASLFHILANPISKVPSLGASGAIAGVMGAYMLLFPRVHIRTLLFLGIFIQVIRVPAAVMLGYWMLIQVLSGFAEYGTRTGSGIAWFAHIGGFVTGFFLGILMRRAKGRSQLSRTRFLGQRR